MPTPAWLPSMYPVSPWSGKVLEDLYGIFVAGFIASKASIFGCDVWFFPEKENGKERIFWHLIEREDKTLGERVADFRRSERLPWARPVIDNHQGAEVLCWDYEEGAGDVRTYVWLHESDYVIVMKRIGNGSRRLITAYFVDYESKRRSLGSKYRKRIQ